MNLIKFLNNFFRRAPVLKQKYFVKEGSEVMAILSDPLMSDQFWFDFILTPTSNDEAQLARIYDYDRWLNQEYTYIEAYTGREVEFAISIDLDDDGTEIIDVMKDRPKRIRLRGPHPLEKNQTIIHKFEK